MLSRFGNDEGLSRRYNSADPMPCLRVSIETLRTTARKDYRFATRTSETISEYLRLIDVVHRAIHTWTVPYPWICLFSLEDEESKRVCLCPTMTSNHALSGMMTLQCHLARKVIPLGPICISQFHIGPVYRDHADVSFECLGYRSKATLQINPPVCIAQRS